MIVVAKCSYYFMHEANDDYDFLYDYFGKDEANRNKLLSLGQSIGSETFPLSRLYGFVQNNLEVAKHLFFDFARRMTGEWKGFE